MGEKPRWEKRLRRAEGLRCGGREERYITPGLVGFGVGFRFCFVVGGVWETDGSTEEAGFSDFEGGRGRHLSGCSDFLFDRTGVTSELARSAMDFDWPGRGSAMTSSASDTSSSDTGEIFRFFDICCDARTFVGTVRPPFATSPASES